MRDEGRLTFHHQWMLAVLTDVGDHPVLRPPRDEELWILVSCLSTSRSSCDLEWPGPQFLHM